MDRTDAKYNQPLTIALSRFEWQAILEAVENAAGRNDQRYAKIIPGARLKIQAALKSGNMAIEAAVHAWIELGNLILAFGNCYARTGGGQIVAAVSAAVHPQRAEATA